MLKRLRHRIDNREAIVALALMAICIVPPVLAFQRIRSFYLPLGGDTGDHLRMSYAIFGINRPMWGQNPLQYPPLLYFVIYPLSRMLGEIEAMGLIGLLLLALRPLAVFICAKRMFKSPFFALIGAVADAFFPSYFELYSFGGYPNLLGFIFLPLAFMYIIQTSSISLKNSFLIFLLSSLTIISHHLTSIIFLITVSLWLFYRLVKREYGIFLGTLIPIFLPAIIYRFLVQGASDFVFFNEFAYYGFVINQSAVLYVFKDLWLLAFLVVLTIVGLYQLSRTENNKTMLLLSWLLSPIVFLIVVAAVPRIMAIDNIRMLFFLVQPMILATVYSLKVLWERRNVALCLGLSSLVIASSISFGFVTLSGAVGYNKAVLEDKYSDLNSYELITWIKYNLEWDSVIATRAPVVDRYVEGVDHIRVLRGGVPPKFLFKQGEYERNLASEAILSTNIFGYSDMFKIKDQSPTRFERTPFIYVFAGDDYKLLGYFSDHYPWELQKLTLNISEIVFGQDFYEIHYIGPNPLNKTVTIKSDEVTVQYRAKETNTKLDNFFWFAWGKNWGFENNVLVTDYGKISMITNASVQKVYDSRWNQWKISVQSWGEQKITFKTEDKRISRSTVAFTTRDDLIKQYKVGHILLRKDDDEAILWISHFPEWKLIYSNQLFSLYSLQNREND